MRETTPTMMVTVKETGKEKLINVSDFDGEKHEKLEVKQEQPKKEAAKPKSSKKAPAKKEEKPQVDLSHATVVQHGETGKFVIVNQANQMLAHEAFSQEGYDTADDAWAVLKPLQET